MVGSSSEQWVRQVTVCLDVPEVTRRLNSALGETLVALLAGATDLNLSSEWARVGGLQPGTEAVVRLRFAYEQWQIVSDAEGEDVARLWFIGASPWLDCDTPVNAIRNGLLKHVAHAAHAVVEDAFSG
ncbi:MAG: hypothetical protein EOO27_38445 [Comamonadaceae bacterium]|nr:MAG: hypothetical protein EOO27_38445 [Comamonadaceae bacterium]